MAVFYSTFALDFWVGSLLAGQTLIEVEQAPPQDHHQKKEKHPKESVESLGVFIGTIAGT
eukprot:1318424-Amphidinium_carterae.1